jgi:starch synthase
MEAGKAKPRVLVTHGGSNPLAYQLVASLDTLGYPYRFETGFYYRKPGLLSTFVSLVPGAPGRHLERELRRRHRDGIDGARVGLHPWPEIKHIAAKRLGFEQHHRARLALERGYALDRHVARRLRSLDPEIAISHDSFALETFRAARALGIPTVLNQCTGHVLDALAIYREEAALNPEFADSLAVDTTAEAAERCRLEAIEADRVLAPSAYVRETLIAHGVAPARIAHLPYGVDSTRFRPADGPRKGPFRILYMGQIGQKKGIKYLLEAVRRLALPGLELLLVGGIVGSGNGLAPYREWFRHVAHVPYHEVHALYRDANIFVYPSLHEGSAFANLEAMASGLPVITTTNAGAPVSDGEDGFILPIRDTVGLMARIELLYRDRTRLAEMGARARERAKGLTWARYRAELDRILLDSLQPPKP